jgi:hypothetical protein
MSRYFSPQQINQIVTETEAELDRRAIQAEADTRLARIQAWIADPRNKEMIDNNEVVKKLRAMPQCSQPNVPSTTPRLGAPHTTPSGLPPGCKDRATLERERPWLAPRKTELESVIDPYAGRKPNRI